MPEPLPIPRASNGHFSPDGRRIAYRMINPWDAEWRNYRGGQAMPIAGVVTDEAQVADMVGRTVR